MILTDQPLNGLDKAMWWIEYVIRHKDVSHLRSSAADMTFLQYLMIDVVLFLLAVLFLCVKVLYLIWTFLKPRRKLKTN